MYAATILSQFILRIRFELGGESIPTAYELATYFEDEAEWETKIVWYWDQCSLSRTYYPERGLDSDCFWRTCRLVSARKSTAVTSRIVESMTTPTGRC